MTYLLHPSKYIARIHAKRKFRPHKPGDFERVRAEMEEVWNRTYRALTKKHGRPITGEGTCQVKPPNRIYMTMAYAFYDQG